MYVVYKSKLEQLISKLHYVLRMSVYDNIRSEMYEDCDDLNIFR